MNTIYAHTLDQAPPEMWEPLYGENGHAEKVATLAEKIGSQFGGTFLEPYTKVFRLMGEIHDMGKASNAFQEYMHRSWAGKAAVSVDHKSAAALWALRHVHHPFLGILMAYALLGHHSGLGVGSHFLTGRGEPGGERFQQPIIAEALENDAAMVHRADVTYPKPRLHMDSPQELLFVLQLSLRMMHSSLVDADWLATEAFCEPQRAEERASIRMSSIPELDERLETAMSAREAECSGAINALRQQIRQASLAAANKAPGVFKLNVPTGGGKTLSSLSFALKHASLHRKQRIIYVIPYTSIIDQTARVFREVLGEDSVLEHHSNLAEENDSEANRFLSENWDAPLIVTTNVQFFESFFSAKNKRCRKLHNIANSVIIFDEAQSLPTEYLEPCLALMRSLERHFCCTLVLCTATQPTLETDDQFNIFRSGWREGEVQSLIGEAFEAELAVKMKRVQLRFLGAQTVDSLLAHYRETGVASALFIVNLTRQAQQMFNTFQEAGVPGLYHLSARMCPAHRQQVLDAVSARLKGGEPTVLIATRVIEAGVDVSFPLVYRDRCGLDSLAQSAGRCNRHGELPAGLVFAYEAAEKEYAIPPTFVNLRDAAYSLADLRRLKNSENESLFTDDCVREYFHSYFERRGREGVDKADIMALVGKQPASLYSWDFPEMDDRTHLIPPGQYTVLVPYGTEGEQLREELIKRDRMGLLPTREQLRRMQPLSLSVYEQERKDLSPHLECLHHKAGIHMLSTTSLYHDQTGLGRLSDSAPLLAIC